jgi:hypothetical protein
VHQNKFSSLAWTQASVVLTILALAGCGGGNVPASTTHSVTVSWMPSNQTGVNSPGGGYQVAVNARPPIDVPYVSGPMAPTSVTTTLTTGTYTVTVRAYAELDSLGGSTGSLSAVSAPLTVVVP